MSADEQAVCWKCGQLRPGAVSPCPYCSSPLTPTPGTHQTWNGNVFVPYPPRPRAEQRNHDRLMMVLTIVGIAIAVIVAAMVGLL